MDKIINVLETLEKTSSRNDKELILKENYNNENLKNVLIYAMNPFYIYGIGKKAFSTKQTGNSEFNNIFDLLEYLKVNNTGTDIIKHKVNVFINSQEKQYQEWYKRIILKDLRIGVTEKTVNKIWSNLVPVFEVMLAKPFERLYDEIACEVKLDGVRCIAVKQNGTTNLFTRNGKAIEGYNNIINDINLLPVDNLILDGEIISGDYTGTMNNLFTKNDNKQGVYNIFDTVSLEEFNSGRSKSAYIERKSILNNYSTLSIDNNSLMFIAPLTIMKNPDITELNALTNQVVQQGFEGIMIKNTQGLYESKRSFDWQKLKPFFSEEFTIIDFAEGDGKYKGTLGKVIVDVCGKGVGVGSGWTDEQRNEVWNNKSKYLGRVLEVQYQEKIEKTGSLRFPTVKGFREF